MAFQLLRISSSDKATAINVVQKYFTSQGYKIVEQDLQRPWGFYFYFDPAQSQKFIKDFFNDTNLPGIDTKLPLQPKVLVFEPGKLNSWQYHHRRAEIWRVITNSMQTITSGNDEPGPVKALHFGDVINFTQGMRHRGGAVAGEWGAVAEIWQHTDPNHPSDEQDIVRLQDDYGRA